MELTAPQPGFAPKPVSATILPTLLPLGIFLLAVVLRLIPGPRTIDDSFITYRYAHNLLNGEGFVFNPGERVLGTTTPLYTFLMVMAGLLASGLQPQTAPPFPEMALLINAFADGVVCLLLLRLGERLKFQYAGIGAALAWAVAPFSVTFAIGGLETSVFVLLLTAAIVAHIEERRILAALLSALAVLTRPDALILVGPLALDRIWQWLRAEMMQPASQESARKPGAILPELLAFFIPVAGWVAFSTLYFSSPIPHSIAAKSLAYRLGPEAALVRLLQHYGTPFLEHLTFGLPWIGVGLILYLFLYLVAARRVLTIEPHIWPYLAYPWLYFVVFASANPLIFRWYLTPPLPPYFLFILGGAEILLTGLFRSRLKWIPVLLIVVLPGLLSLRDWRLVPDHGLNRPAPEMAWYRLELLYRQAIDELLHIPPEPGTLLAAGDVGVLGFFGEMRVLDTVGLNSPQSTRYYPLDPSCYQINYAIPPDLILDSLPDWIVILEVYGRNCLLSDPAFQQHYRLRQKIPTDIYGSDGLLILEKIQP